MGRSWEGGWTSSQGGSRLGGIVWCPRDRLCLLPLWAGQDVRYDVRYDGKEVSGCVMSVDKFKERTKENL